VLELGDRIPDVTVQSAPGEDVRLRELVADGPILLLFYLFDWSST
jgi:peroxiredoxin